eukprot:10986.XXX_366451_366570_1 [CDS] Oithona nana genome sequencing.
MGPISNNVINLGTTCGTATFRWKTDGDIEKSSMIVYVQF